MIHYKMVFLVEIRARTKKVLYKLCYIVQIYQIMIYTDQYKTGRPNRHIDVLDKEPSFVKGVSTKCNGDYTSIRQCHDL